MKLLRFISVLLGWSALGQSTQVQINVKDKTTLQAVTVQTWQTNLLANVIDGGFYKFVPASADAADGENILNATGVAGKWHLMSLTATNLTVTGNGDYNTMTVTNLTIGNPWDIGGTGMDIRWFGATKPVADDDTTDFAGFAAAAAYAQTYGHALKVPGGVWDFKSASDVIDITGSLVIDGGGMGCVLKHAGLTTSAAMFRFTTGTNLVIRNMKFTDARYLINFATGHPDKINLLIENCEFHNTAKILLADQEMTGGTIPNTIDSITLKNVRYYGVTNTVPTSAGVWIDKVPIKSFKAIDSQFYNGQFGIRIALDDIPATVNPWDVNQNVVIENCLFDSQDTTYDVDVTGVELLACNPRIYNCVFRNGARNAPTASVTALYLYGGHGTVQGCFFDRWGNAAPPVAQYTVTLKGAELAYDQFVTNSVGTYNRVPGWGLTLRDCHFLDDWNAPKRTGKVLMDTDGIKLENCVWENFNDSTLPIINLSSSGGAPAPELPASSLVGCTFKRCNFSRIVLATGTVLTMARGIDILGNLFINCGGGAEHSIFERTEMSQGTRFCWNRVLGTNANLVGLRLATSSQARWHKDVEFIGNEFENAKYGLYFSGGAEGAGGFVTNLVAAWNSFTNVTTPIYINSYTTTVNSRVQDNHAVNCTNPTLSFNVGNTNIGLHILNNVGGRFPSFISGATTTPDVYLPTAYPGSLVLQTNGTAWLKKEGSTTTGWSKIQTLYQPTYQLVDQNSDTFGYNGDILILDPDGGDRVLTSAPHISGGNVPVTGDRVQIMVPSGSANSITLTDEGTLVSSGWKMATGHTNFVVADGNSLFGFFDGTRWQQIP